MSSENDKNDAESENMCVVCCKPIEVYAIGCCDHPVCYECSTRMRVLCKQNECPICRQDMPKVIFTKEKDHFANFSRLTERHYLQERNFGMVFATQSVQKAYYRLLEHNCNICKQDRRWPFKNFNDLKDHMRKEHEQFYCELCVANLNIFTSERRSYTRAELGMHRRRGDTDNTSHRGHPLCEFCDTRYMDNDELFRHLRRDHFYCHFCDADGKHHYYNVYEDLRAHFLQDHFLCEEGNCKNEQFTSVFRSDIDLKAHQASVHSKDLGKFGTKQARTLEVAFTLAPRPGGNQNRRQQHQNRNNRGANDDEDGATGFDNYYMEPGGNRPGYEGGQKRPMDPMNAQDFPQLGNGPNVSQSRPTSTVTFSKFTSKPFSGDDFPSLGGGSSSNHAPSAPNVTITAHSKVVASRANEVTITRTSKNQPNFAMRSQNFPALGGGPSGIGNSTVRLSISSGNGQSRPQSSRSNVSIHVRNPANVAITTRINTAPTSTTIQVRPKVTDFPALSGGKVAAPPAQWVQQKSKKKETKQDPAKVNPAPDLPPSSLDFPVLQRGTTGNETKTAKKRTSVTMPVSNSWVNLNNFNSENRNCGDRASQASAGNESDFVELQNKKDEKNRGNIKGKKDQKQKKTNNKKKKGDYETEPTTSTEEDVNKNLTETKSVNGIVKKVTELKIDNVNGDNGYASGGETRRGPPPPGFTVKPPPGFVNCNNHSPSDLTFTNSSGQSFPILPTALANEYRMPQNFERRNETLIRNFKEVMSDPEAISEFKNFSTLFRQNKYPAENYYRLCREVLGTHFGKLFPELLVLLPDISKQTELFRVHSANVGSMKDFELCLTCQQVLAPRDFREHISKHSLENNFPILSQQAQPTTNYWRK